MTKKYQIFVSSTYVDLIAERQDAIRSILDLGHIPSGMEGFPAADVEQFEYIKKVIDECDYYVLIVGGRYGSVDQSGTSYTEREYDYAVETGKTVLVFLHAEPEKLSSVHVDHDPGTLLRLQAFREKVSGRRLVKMWTSREELRAHVIIALSKAFSEVPAVGWIRGDAAASETLLQQMNMLRDELDAMRKENEALRRSAQPVLQNLAGMDEPFTVRYSWWEWVAGRNQKRHGSSDFTWRQIFEAVGPVLIKPSNPSVLALGLVHYMKDNFGLGRDVTISESDLNKIKVHLSALQLIELYSAEATGGGLSEFVCLTDFGRARLTEMLAVESVIRST